MLKLTTMTAMILLIGVTSLQTTAAEQEQYSFGPDIQIEQAQDVSDVIADPISQLGKQVTIKGVVEAICENKQCWMSIVTRDYEPKFRIKVNDGEMKFPFSAKGKTAYVAGTFEKWEQSEATRPGYQLKATTVLIAH